MRKSSLILMAMLGVFVNADEPSLAYNCKSGLLQYKAADLIRFDICPVDKGILEVDIVSFGSNYHSCWWNTKLVKNNNVYTAKEHECEVQATIKDGILSAEFSGDCRFFCGARASFKDGEYKLDTSNN